MFRSDPPDRPRPGRRRRARTTTAAERKLADNKAKLKRVPGHSTPRRARTPRRTAQLPAYRLYDADSKRQAAELTDDPAARKANLNAALGQYQTAQGRRRPDADCGRPVQLGESGSPQFDLGPLPRRRRQPSRPGDDQGRPAVPGPPTAQRSANPQYWETYYKQPAGRVAEVAKSDRPTDPQGQGST